MFCLCSIWDLGCHCSPSVLSRRQVLVPLQPMAHLEDPSVLLLGYLVVQLVRTPASSNALMV